LLGQIIDIIDYALIGVVYVVASPTGAVASANDVVFGAGVADVGNAIVATASLVVVTYSCQGV
jgi:hypothetical protein